MSTKAQKRAQARYDAKRPTGVLVRLEDAWLREIDARRKEGESRAAAIKRLLKNADAIDALVREPTIDYVAGVARMANRIKENQLREKMNHKITEGDVWAIIGAVRDIGQA